MAMNMSRDWAKLEPEGEKTIRKNCQEIQKYKSLSCSHTHTHTHAQMGSKCKSTNSHNRTKNNSFKNTQINTHTFLTLPVWSLWTKAADWYGHTYTSMQANRELDEWCIPSERGVCYSDTLSQPPTHSNVSLPLPFQLGSLSVRTVKHRPISFVRV